MAGQTTANTEKHTLSGPREGQTKCIPGLLGAQYNGKGKVDQ
jgi:hypothetical protein